MLRGNVLGFLHTAAGHVETFTTLTRAIDPAVRTCHVVRPELLAVARARGPEDAQVQTGVRRALHDLAADGATVLVCTCSTIGSVAERTDVGPRVDVMRLDRPMAEQAVKLGRRITVVAALPSALGPTRALLQDAAGRAGRSIELTDAVCADAWEHFERGDVRGYLGEIARTIDAASGSADVVVLAQASMAPAAERRGAGGMPVLSSPRLGVESAIRRLREQRQAPSSSIV